MSRRNNKSEIEVVSLSKYTTPTVEEVKNKEWVMYGEDNNHFQWLIDRSIKSTTNGGIITSMARMIYGKGLDATDSNKKPEQYAQMKRIFSKDCLRGVIMDRKLLGMGAFQINYKGGKVNKALHFPMNTLRAEKCNDDGEIEAWYYHPNWAEAKPSDEPLRIPAFGFGNGKENEILVVKPYVAGYTYYPPVDYQGALPYAVLEEEIADYLINDTLNGFSGTKVINFNNGVPDEEKRREIKRDVMSKLTGARGEKVIVAFNNNKEGATTVEDLPLNDAPQHYEYLSKECQEKLIVGHKVTSPMLLGIRTGNSGLGNNADEIKTASLLYDNLVIRTFQDELLDVINEILAFNGISLNTYFKTIQPLEFTDLDNVVDEETKEEETGVKMCSHEDIQLKDDALDDLGEKEDLDEWELIDEMEVDYDLEEQLDAEIEALNNPKKSLLSKIYNFVSTGTARPNAKSEQDKKIDDVQYKVRYSYSPNRVSANSRDFCKKMVAADKIYRKEDIVQMSQRVVNAGWGARGADTYDIFKYKGGGDCHHKWLRKTYRSKKSIDVKSPLAPTVSTNKAEKEGYRVRNPKEVAMKPKDMPYNGFLPTNKRFK
jgi:hypothetical protein